VPQERTEVVVLRGVDFSETSRIVTFLSPDRGRLACMAAGARRPRSPLSAVLDTFNRLEIVYYWKESRSVQKLGEAALLDAYPGIKRELSKTLYAAFPLEVAYKAAQENEPSTRLYGVVVRGLEGMATWPGDAKAHAAWQVLQILSAAGFEPAIDPGGTPAGFAYESGVTGSIGRADRTLTPGVLDALRALTRARDACPAVPHAGPVFDLLRGYVSHQLETDFRSLRVIDQVFG